jgi:hypothetical protein
VKKPAREKKPSKFRQEVRGAGKSYIVCLGKLLGSGGKTVWRINHEKPEPFEWGHDGVWLKLRYPVHDIGNLVVYWRGNALSSGPNRLHPHASNNSVVCFKRNLPSHDASALTVSYTTTQNPEEQVYHGPKLSDQPKYAEETKKANEDLSVLRQKLLEERA